ncbi:DUF4070 domain-containing protein [Gloeobacter morelensis]|uniref:DUF4070 domain-containing protein n=1 Tax=Gloeobacter morelensis TaxID=2907343 RepID=UPI001E3776B0
MVHRKPRLVFEYMGQCAAEHFFEYRQEARSHIAAELGFDPLSSAAKPHPALPLPDELFAGLGAPLL